MSPGSAPDLHGELVFPPRAEAATALACSCKLLHR